MTTPATALIDAPVVDLGATPPEPPAPGGPVGGRWLPGALAVLAFVVMSALVLSQTEKLVEPDPYAYRASIAALEDGNLTLTQDEYVALSAQLATTDLGGGIQQWHQNADGLWVSEKNPGYPFLAVGFDAVGGLRLAPLFYGALACLGLWLGGRRWLGRWGGTFAVGTYCSAAIVMVMAWRSTMPTFTDASLVALGLGLMVWVALSVERSRRVRTAVGAAAFFALGLAFFVRYTNIAVLAVVAVFALLVCVRPRFGLRWTSLPWWAMAALPPIIAALAYNAAVFDGPFSTGYSSTSVQFALSAVGGNLRIMPAHLWRSMPVFVVGLAAVAGLVVVQVIAGVRGRGAVPAEDALAVVTAGSDPGGQTPTPTPPALGAPVPTVGEGTEDVPTLVADRWIGFLLVAAWVSVWGLYSAYEWTTQVGGGGGGPFGGGGLGDATYSLVRFYLPAMGAIALLVAWLLVRLPRVVGVLALVALFVVGGAGFLSTVDSQWASMFSGGLGGGGPFAGGAPAGGPGAGAGAVPGGAGGGGRPDFSKCPNLPTRPDGFQPPPGADVGGGTPSGGTPGAGFGGGPPVGLTFDENGCPVIADPGASTGAAPDASTG